MACALLKFRECITVRRDMAVIGGGPAGLATAIAARLAGLSVVLMDAARPPIDKACGEGILPGGVALLRQLGVRFSQDDALPFHGIRFIDDGVSVEAHFPGGPALAIRRTRLHGLLAERASQLGVRLLWGANVTDTSQLADCRWIVGADGSNSRVRTAARLDEGGRPTSRFGFRRHYRISPWTDFVEVHWGSHCQIYITPVSRDEVGVALLTRDSSLRLDAALKDFPDLQRRLRGAARSSGERGGVTVSRRLRRVFRGNTALIGDASGSVDAITGEGLSLSFHQAIALSKAVTLGDLAPYQAEHLRLMRRPRLVASALLLLDRLPLVRRSVLRALALDPPVFAHLLARPGCRQSVPQ